VYFQENRKYVLWLNMKENTVFKEKTVFVEFYAALK